VICRHFVIQKYNLCKRKDVIKGELHGEENKLWEELTIPTIL
jgi:hypothetical protein